MGASDIYSIASGLAEFTAGILLLWRRTWLAGGFLAMLAMAQVFLLNLCYDVPVKLLSGTLLATAIAITFPYWSTVLQVREPSTVPAAAAVAGAGAEIFPQGGVLPRILCGGGAFGTVGSLGRDRRHRHALATIGPRRGMASTVVHGGRCTRDDDGTGSETLGERGDYRPPG